MSTEETQRRRLTEILEQTSAALDPAEEAEALYARGVRVLQLDEVILSRTDAKLLDHVRQAAERWELKKQEAKEQSREQLDGSAFREAQILAALIGAGKPLSRVPAIQAAAGWHPDYRPSPAEWEPWRAAWRELLIQRRIQRANNPSLGERSTWKATPVPAGGWHPVLVEFWERRREFPGLCVALVPGGRSTMYGDICGKPERIHNSGGCEEHAQEIRDVQ